MSTYLSLDLDFFNNSKHARDEEKFTKLLEQQLDLVGEFVKVRKIPCVAVMNHQQMLRFVNESGCNVLFNVDTHSDLADTDVSDFSCGTWVSYVSWRKNGHFHWRHASSAIHGDCSGNLHMFGRMSARQRAKVTDWQKVTHERNQHMPALTNDITSVGVCLSPSYVCQPDGAAWAFNQWIKKYKIPYVKGRRDEWFSVTRSPK